MLKFALLSFIAFVLCLQAKAQTLALSDADSPRAWIHTISTVQIVADAPSGDGSSSSAPTTVYVPIKNTTNANQSIIANAANELPNFGGLNWTGNIAVELNANNTTGTDYYLYAAVQDSGSTYKLIRTNGDLIPHNTNVDHTFWFSMSEFCTVANCANSTITTLEKSVFFFLASSQPAASFSVDSLTGQYFKFKFSSVVNSQPISLNDLRRGDERLIMEYSNGPVLNDFYEVVVFKYSSTAGVVSQNTYAGAVAAGGSIIVNSEASTMPTSGYYTVKNLQNGVKVNLALAFVDKFQFATYFSNSRMATPEQIDVFLEKQGCYLLSAGFQEEHYVLEYFKKFRNEVLLKSSLGKNFVSFYYGTAPQYTSYIYNSPVLSALVRGLAYGLYFIFNFFPYLLILSLIPLFFLGRRLYFKA